MGACAMPTRAPRPHTPLPRLAALLDSGGDWPSTSLIRNVLGASSTDHVEESALNLLIPEERVTFGMGVSYWSSKGSDSAGSMDWVALRLAHPLCLLREIRLRPFKAWFQPGAPIYAPQFVRFRVGGAMLFDPGNWQLGPAWLPPAPPEPPQADDPGGWDAGGGTWESPLFPVDPNSAADQLFELPQPVLCVGGLLVIELIGKVKQQLQDNLFYGRCGSGLGLARCEGVCGKGVRANRVQVPAHLRAYCRPDLTTLRGTSPIHTHTHA